ncbi:MAG: PP2C family protein-serine/threonine phosphatase [Aquificaceae bacterium]
MYRVKICGITHRGKMRDRNEDALLMNDMILQEEVMSSPLCFEREGGHFIFAVADGLGGHAAGEMASKLALQTLMELRPKNLEDIVSTLHKARDRLEEFARENAYAYGLGTAVAGLVLSDEGFFVFNVGDCRVYGLEDEKIKRLTVDHTEVERLVRLGYISEEEAKSHPNRHMLTSALIGNPSFEEFEVHIKKVNSYKSFLICSDGLWEAVENYELFLTPSELLLLALKRGGKDNISILRLRVFQK